MKFIIDAEIAELLLLSDEELASPIIRERVQKLRAEIMMYVIETGTSCLTESQRVQVTKFYKARSNPVPAVAANPNSFLWVKSVRNA